MTTDKRNPFFELRRSRIQGRGAFALRKIRRGTRIVQYVGEVIDDDEADRRYDDDAMGRHHTFLFTLDDDTCVDGAVGGNEASYINHSCDPNCEAVIVDGRIFIEALRTIQPGEELLYDYQYEREGSGPEYDAQYPCRCGSPNCRGTIVKPEKKRRKKAVRTNGARRKR